MMESKAYDEMIEEFMTLNLDELKKCNQKEFNNLYVSEINYHQRKHMISNDETGVRINIGDICYIDFGKAYQHEIGYQHFGLVISICRGKILVVPMTSNAKAISKARSEENPNGKSHLFSFPKAGKMNKDSVLFLNDIKFINPARVIDVKGHISVHSNLFSAIKLAVINIIL